MKLEKVRSSVPLTRSCEVAVANTGSGDCCLVLEVKQEWGEDVRVTTLLLSHDRAREIAEILLRHAGGFSAPSGCAPEERCDAGGQGVSQLVHRA